MNKRCIFFQLFLGAFVFSMHPMQRDVIFMEDAISLARSKGVSGQALVELETKLLGSADTTQDTFPINRKEAYQLIEEAMVAQALAQAPEREPGKETFGRLKVYQFFNKSTPYHKQFESMKRQLFVARKEKDELKRALEVSTIEQKFIKELQKESASPWFYTGDLLWRVLFVKNTLPLLRVSSVHGPVFTLLDTKKPLSTLNLKTPFVYLLSFNQIENICGFAALANAYAIEQQVKDDQTITFERTRQLAQEVFLDKIERDPVFKELQCGVSIQYGDASQVIAVAEHLGLDTEAFEFLDSDTVQFLHSALKEGRPVDRNAEIITKLITRPVTHFIYNVGKGHWVLLSAVRSEHGSTLFLLNSSNAPLRENDEVVQLIRHIDDLIRSNNV